MLSNTRQLKKPTDEALKLQADLRVSKELAKPSAGEGAIRLLSARKVAVLFPLKPLETFNTQTP